MNERPWPATARGQFLAGFRDITPVIIATIPFALVYGALAIRQGLSVAETTLMSALVYGGASQLVALEFWADPLPFWTVLFAALAVNLRHVLYSAAIGRRLAPWPPLARWLGFGLLTDPSFALAELRGQEGRLTPAYYFGMGVPLYINWVVSAALGGIAGSFITRPEAIGLDVVATAYFIIMLLGFRQRPNAIWVIITSATGALATYLTLGPPWHFAGGALPGMLVAAALARPRAATP